MADDPILFPPGKSGNILRGGFGTIFRKLACLPECPGAQTCEIRASCAYARIFEPSASGTGPSGLSDWPRPFVFRASHLDGRMVAPGEGFSFDLHVFDLRDPALAYFVLAFAQLAREGLGPRRGRASLTEVVQLDVNRRLGARLYNGGAFRMEAAPAPLVLPLSNDGAVPVERVRVRFITPTELKAEARLVSSPEFPILFARIRDRVSTLRALYGDGPLEIDFKEMGKRAAAVRMTRCEVRQVDVERRSSRTGQVHSIGGFVGEAEYEGDLTEFVPYLKAAAWTGVGRQTVWGKGEIEVDSGRTESDNFTKKNAVRHWTAACYSQRDDTMNEEALPEDLSNLLQAIATKKERLDRLRPLSPDALAKLEHYYDIELTYASNAIEGNTLSPVETTLVIEKGITVGGKPLKDHLEALDHYEAMRYIRELGRHSAPLTEGDIRNLHFVVVQRSQPEIAGRYANLPRYVRTETGRHAFPSPAEVPSLMGDFAAWLRGAPDSPDTAFEAHRRVVDIHPFNDGNGRTARLLMNLILIRGGYPPIAVRPEDRLSYTRALQRSQAGHGTEDFERLLCERLDATLGEYLSALNEALKPEGTRDRPGPGG